MTFDVGVIGLGAAGAMAAWRAAVSGANVLAIEQFEPGHRNGSSHGGTRIVRRLTTETDGYHDTITRSLELFGELGRVRSQPLFVRTGGLMIASSSDPALRSAVELAEQWGIEVEPLDADTLRARFPAFRVSDADGALYEPGAGYVAPERAIRGAVEVAAEHDATILTRCHVVRVVDTDKGVDIVIADGTRLRCRRVILALGVWAAGSPLLPTLAKPAGTIVKRTLSVWFSAAADASPFHASQFPVFSWGGGKDASAWGVTDPSGTGIKVGLSGYSTKTLVGTEEIERNNSDAVTITEQEPIEDFVRSHFNGLHSPALRAEPCMKIVLPDDRCAVGPVADDSRTIVVTGLNGHGFKHAPALGEAAAELALDRGPTIDISGLSLARFSG